MHDHLDPIKDTDYELIDEHNLQNYISLYYMKHVIDSYDEINQTTYKRKRKRRTIKHSF